MPENPISDVIEFLTDPSWPMPVFWLLVIASVGIAILIWHRRPDQRDFRYLAQWSFRFVMGDFWWQQSLWKLPSLYTNHPKAPLTTGLTYWMHQMVQSPRFRCSPTWSTMSSCPTLMCSRRSSMRPRC